MNPQYNTECGKVAEPTTNEIPRNVESIKVEIQQLSEMLATLEDRISTVLGVNPDDKKLAQSVPSRPMCCHLGSELGDISDHIANLRLRVMSVVERVNL